MLDEAECDEVAVPGWPPPQFASECCEVELPRAGREEDDDDEDEDEDVGIVDATS